MNVPAVLEGRLQLPLPLASLCTLCQGSLQLAFKAADFSLQLLLCLSSPGLQILQLLLELEDSACMTWTCIDDWQPDVEHGRCEVW